LRRDDNEAGDEQGNDGARQTPQGRHDHGPGARQSNQTRPAGSRQAFCLDGNGRAVGIGRRVSSIGIVMQFTDARRIRGRRPVS
jgi:hypothetical protein